MNEIRKAFLRLFIMLSLLVVLAILAQACASVTVDKNRCVTVNSFSGTKIVCPVEETD